MEFKDLIYTRRKALNKTLDEVAQIVGVSKTTVQRWESGNIKNIKFDKIENLAKALETTPEYLMGVETDANMRYFVRPNFYAENMVKAMDSLPETRVALSMPKDYDLLTTEEKEKIDEFIQLLLKRKKT